MTTCPVSDAKFAGTLTVFTSTSGLYRLGIGLALAFVVALFLLATYVAFRDLAHVIGRHALLSRGGRGWIAVVPRCPRLAAELAQLLGLVRVGRLVRLGC